MGVSDILKFAINARMASLARGLSPSTRIAEKASDAETQCIHIKGAGNIAAFAPGRFAATKYSISRRIS